MTTSLTLYSSDFFLPVGQIWLKSKKLFLTLCCSPKMVFIPNEIILVLQHPLQISVNQWLSTSLLKLHMELVILSGGSHIILSILLSSCLSMNPSIHPSSLLSFNSDLVNTYLLWTYCFTWHNVWQRVHIAYLISWLCVFFSLIGHEAFKQQQKIILLLFLHPKWLTQRKVFNQCSWNCVTHAVGPAFSLSFLKQALLFLF